MTSEKTNIENNARAKEGNFLTSAENSSSSVKATSGENFSGKTIKERVMEIVTKEHNISMSALKDSRGFKERCQDIPLCDNCSNRMIELTEQFVRERIEQFRDAHRENCVHYWAENKSNEKIKNATTRCAICQEYKNILENLKKEFEGK